MSRANSALGGAYSIRSLTEVGVVARSQSRRLAAIWLHTRCRCSTAYALVPSREHCVPCRSRVGQSGSTALCCKPPTKRTHTRLSNTLVHCVTADGSQSRVGRSRELPPSRVRPQGMHWAGTVCYSPKDTERALTPRALTRTYCRRHNASRRSSTARSLKLKHRHGLERPPPLCPAPQRASSLCLHHGHGPAHLEGRKISTAKSLL
jgi:hypothetical protein